MATDITVDILKIKDFLHQIMPLGFCSVLTL